MTRSRALWVGTCAALLILYAGLAWTAVSTKSPTYDEPLHALAGWVHLHWHDFRVDAENPPLWKYWAALPNGPEAIRADPDAPAFRRIPGQHDREWEWTSKTLFGSPGNDGDRLIRRSRAMMLVLAVALGALAIGWSSRLGGAVAAVVTAWSFAFDPTLLAHGPLVKNDVALALVMLALAVTIWRAGVRLTGPRVALVALVCAAAPCVKFSGIAVAMCAFVPLILRALCFGPWHVGSVIIEGRWGRAGVTASLGLLCFLAAFGSIWASYGFTARTAPDPGVRLSFSGIARSAALQESRARLPDLLPTEQELRSRPPSFPVRMVLWARTMGILPEPYLYGLLYIYAATRTWWSFLCDHHRLLGWWYYFPLAFLFKTPLATLPLAFAAPFALLPPRRIAGAPCPADAWALACLTVPPLLYGISATQATANYGLRHMLPVFPFLLVAMGVAAARLWHRRGARIALLALGMGMAIESTLAHPNYIPFFNAASGGARGGLRLLGDSNLDWGQDLKLLARWQRSHPEKKLHLAYFGSVPPGYYGVRASLIPTGDVPETDPGLIPEGSVIAISATRLQAVFAPHQGKAYAPYRRTEPLAVLGGSIYVYEYPLPVRRGDGERRE